MSSTYRYSPEVRERAVRLVFEHRDEYDSEWAAIRSIADKFGCSTETLRNWVRRAERDSGLRPGMTSSEQEELKVLRREVKELRRANEILRKASAYFGPGGARPPTATMIAFIDEHKASYGVEPISDVIEIAPATYYEHKRQEREPDHRSVRAKRDEKLRPEIQRVFDDNYGVYGVRKVWKQLKREGFVVAKCTVRRLMCQMGLRGATRGKAFTVTTIPDELLAHPRDLVERDFTATAPNRLWIADITYVKTQVGFVYVAFITDVFSRYIVGWRASRSLETGLALDALDQAIWDRLDGDPAGLIHHSDHGSQYLSIRYTERLADAGIEPSTGSVGDSFDNAMAETINGLYKNEVIYRRGPWKGLDDVEYATLEWVDWFNHRRILEPIGDIPPAEYEANYYRQTSPAQDAGPKQNSLR
ncbi:MAG: IS3 family transposase [Acidimicrobiia bacterium]